MVELFAQNISVIGGQLIPPLLASARWRVRLCVQDPPGECVT